MTDWNLINAANNAKKQQKQGNPNMLNKNAVKDDSASYTISKKGMHDDRFLLARDISEYFSEPFGRWIGIVSRVTRNKNIGVVYTAFATAKDSKKDKKGQVKELMFRLRS